MENKMYQDEFEQFLQDEVKQHRMYPSDHIWKNIRTEMHGYKAWPALTFISLFVISALTVSTLVSNHPHQQPVLKGNRVMSIQQPGKATSSMAVAAPASTNYFETIAAEQITAETFADLNENSILPEQAVTVLNSFNDNTQPVAFQPSADRNKLSLSEKTLAKQPPAAAEPYLDNTWVIGDNTIALQEQPAATDGTSEITTGHNKETEAVTAAEKRMDLHARADDFLKDFSYVSNTSPRRNSKFGFQFYITPSTSYRRLSDEKVKEVIQPAVSAATQNVPLSLNNTGYATDVNNVVRHKPAVGIEAGFAVLYNMSSRLKFKTGVQLNIRQYYIETFQSLTNDLTSLSLINFRGVETISFYSPYNNNTGYRKTQLDNKVYQVSIPVGIEWEMIQGKHFGINSEASVQPTMTLNNNTYLLSTDYKHYTDGNDFIRKWNINTSVGLNLTYRSGNTSWQIGPQIRYQHLPTYSNAYPVKEYLLDYGMRLGFTRQIK